MPASYEAGTTLVYPHHGAVTITNLTTRDIKGTRTKYMTLRVHSNDLIIQAAIDKAADLGVRDVIDQAGVDKVDALPKSERSKKPRTGPVGSKTTNPR